jgi:MFS superfamily sulfate permease-like transporter
MGHVTAGNASRCYLRAVATWKEDLLASIVVFLVALPLSMGLALVAGYPFESAAAVGLISGVIGGLVVGALSGTPLQVSGAANGAAVMMAVFAKEQGFDALGPIVMIAGFIQFAAGGLRLGPVFRAVSPALIQGMLAGIGILIFASQFHVMVDDVPPGTGKEFGGVINLWSLVEAVWKGMTQPAHLPAARIGLLTIAIIAVWSNYAPAGLKLVPAPLLGVVAATTVAWYFGYDIKYVPAPDDLLAAITLPTREALARAAQGAIWMAGLSLAFVAGAESLLTSTAVDAMQRRTPRTRYNKELVAQGAGNLLCGMLGVLPVSGVIVRSSANVQAGGRTRLSTMLHGIWILLFITLLPGVLRLIPVASLAAVLVYAGLKLIKLSFVKSLWTQDRAEIGIYVATLGTVVMVDLLTGIAVGIGLALARLLYTFSHLEVTVEEGKGKEVTGRTGNIYIHLKGAATFIRLPKLAAALEKVPSDAHVHIYFHELTYIDHACLDLLVNWEQQHQAAGGELVIDWSTLHAVFQQHAWGGRANSPRAVDV